MRGQTIPGWRRGGAPGPESYGAHRETPSLHPCLEPPRVHRQFGRQSGDVSSDRTVVCSSMVGRCSALPALGQGLRRGRAEPVVTMGATRGAVGLRSLRLGTMPAEPSAQLFAPRGHALGPTWQPHRSSGARLWGTWRQWRSDRGHTTGIGLALGWAAGASGCVLHVRIEGFGLRNPRPARERAGDPGGCYL